MRTVLFLLLVLIPGAVGAQQLPEAACRTLHQERAKHPANLLSICGEAGDARCPLGAMLNAAALAAGDGLGLSRKETGFFVTSPAGRVASDVLMLADGTYWDVFVAGEERAGVSCGSSHGRITDPRRGWVAPVAAGDPAPEGNTHPYERDDDERDECNRIMPGGAQCDRPRAHPIHTQTPKPQPDPDPTPDPTPGAGDFDAMLEILAAMEAKLAVLEQQHQALLAAIKGIPAAQVSDAKIDELIAAVNQARVVEFKLFGQNVTAVVKEAK